MARRPLSHSAVRIVAAFVVATAGLVARAAPAPDAGSRCSACGAMAAKAAAGKGSCCCCTDKGQSPSPSGDDQRRSPCSCPECALPQARVPVVVDDGSAIGHDAPLAILAEIPTAAPPAGVHVSVFHPPRA